MTNYQLLCMNESLMRVLADNRINVNDVRNLEIYKQFEEMKSAGHKVSWIAVFLADKYGMTDRGIYKIVKRLGRKVEVEF